MVVETDDSATAWFTLIVALLVLAVDLVIRILAIIYIPRNRRPQTAMAWLLAIFFIPYVGIILFLLLFAIFVFYQPNALGHADNYIPANPLQTPAHIVPEWYMLPFYAILRAVPDKFGGVVAMFGAIGVLFILPWLDTSKVRSMRYRPTMRTFFIIFLVVGVGLGQHRGSIGIGLRLPLAWWPIRDQLRPQHRRIREWCSRVPEACAHGRW